MAGKGSKPRPIEIEREVYESNWDRIFDKTTAKVHQDGFGNDKEVEEESPSKDEGE